MKLQTIVSKKDGRSYKGTVKGDIVNFENKEVWDFENLNGEIWTCHSDFWDLIDRDIEKQKGYFKDSKVARMLKGLFTKGICK